LVSHENAIKFDGRPFLTIDDMNDKIIRNWNSVVKPEDTVYILGDFAMRKNGQDVYLGYMEALLGNKILILGNHDFQSFSKEQKRSAGIIEVCDYKEVKEDDGSLVICSHYPIMFYRRAYDPKTYHFCGHVHKTREDKFLTQWTNELIRTRENRGDNYGNILNVGCMKDYMDYTPQPFWRLKLYVDERQEFLEEK
jgi:calcineurin-like phosphoesterase family protein